MNSNRIKKWTIIGTSATLGVSLSTGIAYAATNTPEPTPPTPQQTVTNTTQHQVSSRHDLAPQIAHSANSARPRGHRMDRDGYGDPTSPPSAGRHDGHWGEHRDGCRADHRADHRAFGPGRHAEYRYHANRNGAWETMGHHGTGQGHGWGDH